MNANAERSRAASAVLRTSFGISARVEKEVASLLPPHPRVILRHLCVGCSSVGSELQVKVKKDLGVSCDW